MDGSFELVIIKIGVLGVLEDALRNWHLLMFRILR